MDLAKLGFMNGEVVALGLVSLWEWGLKVSEINLMSLVGLGGCLSLYVSLDNGLYLIKRDPK